MGILYAMLGGERKSASMSDALWSALLGGPAKSGVNVTIESALKVSTVLACTRALAVGVAKRPFHVYRPTKDGRGREIAAGHPIDRLISRRPNPWQTPMEWRETMMIHAVLTGNAVSFKNRVRGDTRELIPILPGMLMIEQQADYSLIYRVVFADGHSVALRRDDVWHLKGLSWDSYSGMDVVRLAREAVGLAIVTEETHARLHSNGARPGGILTTDQKLTEADIQRLREAWQQAQGGVENALKTAVLAGGLKFERLSMTGVDSEHLATRRFQIEEICRAMGVHPQAVYHTDKTSTHASAVEFSRAHIDHDLDPWATRIEQVTDRDLLSEGDLDSGLHTDTDFSRSMRGNPEMQAKFYNVMVTTGVMTRNEIRYELGLNPRDGLDEPLQPLNMGAVTGDGPDPDEPAAAVDGSKSAPDGD